MKKHLIQTVCDYILGMKSVERGRRIAAVEWMRLYLILSVFLLHVGECLDKGVKNEVINLFHSNTWAPNYAVNCFFIIGGFFLYKTIAKSKFVSAEEHIGRLWLRLMPAVIFCFLLLVITGVAKWWNFPFCFFPSFHYGFAPSLVPVSDWFVGVYFISSCLFIGLFSLSTRAAWIWVGIITILSWCIILNATPEPKSAYAQARVIYYGFLAKVLLSGLSCMGLGMLASHLSDRWSVYKGGVLFRLTATAFEGMVLFMLFNYMYRRSLVNYSFIAVELVIAAWMISSVHGWGYLSAALNRMGWITRISRYTYSLLLVQGMLVGFFAFNHNFGLKGAHLCLVIFSAAIPFVLIEYHLVEKRLVPLICHKLRGGETVREEAKEQS